MTHPAIPARRREADAPAVALSPEAALTEAADSLGALALCADLIRMPAADPVLSQRVAALISLESKRLAGVLRSLAAGAAVAALLAVGLVVAPLGSPQAQAAELPAAAAPSPSYRVILDASSKTVRVAATTYTTTAAAYHCARVQVVSPGLSVGFSILARGCSRSPWFTVAVPVAAGRFGAGGTYRLAVVDDLADEVTGSATLTVRRPSRVAGQYLADGASGQLFVAVALEHYAAASRTWTPSRYSPIRVQVLVGRTWRTLGTVTTDANGYAGAYLPTGTGTFLVRLVRPAGATVTGAIGAAQRVTVTGMALDVM